MVAWICPTERKKKKEKREGGVEGGVEGASVGCVSGVRERCGSQHKHKHTSRAIATASCPSRAMGAWVDPGASLMHAPKKSQSAGSAKHVSRRGTSAGRSLRTK